MEARIPRGIPSHEGRDDPRPPGLRSAANGCTEAATADFLSGAALIFDFTGSFEWSRVSTRRSARDGEALAGDWAIVGDDLRRAMGHHPISDASLRQSP